jgi:3-methyl-2-oxobutanoate hydroxymethyltransferase
VADLPFLSYATPEQALRSAARCLQEGGAQAVKLEGGERQVATVQRLTDNGIPVCAHLGLNPQWVNKLGGYRVQGREEAAAAQMRADARSLQAAGADMLILECVPAELAQTISQDLDIPVIGIGAGRRCDGQIQVLHDVLGVTPGGAPRFAHNFLQGRGSAQEAVAAYVQAVRESGFPGDEHPLA